MQSFKQERAPLKTEFNDVWTSETAPRGPDATNWDWFTQGVCTQVYNQGQCGSCWAFSATETIESYFAIGGNTLTQFSMEQIVDCDTTDQGCNGGFPENAYKYVQSAGGIESYE
jgi:C1A family cysteine protease